jgi:hypothetical protein
MIFYQYAIGIIIPVFFIFLGMAWGIWPEKLMDYIYRNKEKPGVFQSKTFTWHYIVSHRVLGFILAIAGVVFAWKIWL